MKQSRRSRPSASAAAKPPRKRVDAADAPLPPLYRDDAEPVAFFRTIWPLVVAMAVAAAVRIVQYFVARASDPSFGYCLKGVDTYTYDQWAQAILAGDWFSAKEGRGVFYYGPAYPYFLALVYGIFGHRYGAAHAAQYAVGVLTTGVAFLGLGKWFSRRVAFVAALALAVCPTTLYYEGTLLSSSLDFFLTALFLWAFGAACVRLEGSGGEVTPGIPVRLALAWLLAGLALGVAAIQRANILLCAAGALAWLALAARRGAGGPAPVRLRALLGALFVAGTLLGVSPATWHNVRFGHRWVLVTANGPNMLYLGNAHDATGTFVYPPSFEDLTKKMGRLSVTSGDVRREILAHPGPWVALLAKKFYLFWAAFDPPDNISYDLFRRFSPLLRWNPFGFALLAPLALVGMALSARAWRRVAGLHAFVWTFCASVALVFVVGRYRLPVVYALAGFASLAAWRAWAWVRGGRPWRAAAVAVSAAALALLLAVYAVYPLRIRANDYAMAVTYFTQANRPAGALALLAEGERRYATRPARAAAGSASEQERLLSLALVRELRARLFAQAGQWTEAETALRRLESDRMLTPDRVEMLVTVLMHQGKTDEARRWVAEMQRRAPQERRWSNLLQSIGDASAGAPAAPPAP